MSNSGIVSTPSGEPELALEPQASGDKTSSRKRVSRGGLRRRPLPPIPVLMLTAAVVLAPAPYGSRDGATVSFWCAWFAITIALTPMTRQVLRAWPWLLGLVLLALSWLFVLHEQLADRPFIAEALPLWAESRLLLGISLPDARTLLRGESFYALGVPLAMFCAFTAGFLAFGQGRHRDLLVRVFVISIACYAAFGLLSTMIAPRMLLWQERVAYIGAVTATFVNSNTAADFFSAGAIGWLVVLIRRQHRYLAQSGGRRRRGETRWMLRRRDMPAIASGLCCIFALLLTRSRLGVALGGMTLVATYLILDFRSSRMMRRLAFVAVAGLVLLQLVGSTLLERLDLLGLSDGGRIDTYRRTWVMIADHPWFGVGLGGFGAAFPRYRTDGQLWGIWDAAHSTPFELAAEVGLPLAGLTILAWLALLAGLAHRFLRSRERIAAMALPIVLVGVLHSLGDFSLQIAGYSIPLMAFAGAALRAEIDEGAKTDLRQR